MLATFPNTRTTSGGSFIPDELRSSLGRELTAWDQASARDAAIFRHEFNHYLNTVGTTFGTFLFATWRTEIELAFTALSRAIWPGAKKMLGCLPAPVKLFCELHPTHPLAEIVDDSLRQFMQYRLMNRYEMGDVTAIELNTLNGSRAYLELPCLQISEEVSYSFGARDLLENAARLEDRVLYRDFDCRIFPAHRTYDVLWKWSRAVGLDSPLIVLCLIDIALNPRVLFSKDDPVPSIHDRVAAHRFEILSRVSWDLNERDRLPEAPSLDGPSIPKRGQLDEYHAAMTEVLCRETDYDNPADALEYHLQRFDQISYNQTIRPITEHALTVRKEHPSCFMLPYAADVPNSLASKYPPLLVTSGNRGVSTVSAPEIGAIENLYLIKKAVVNQILLGETGDGYTCPLCKEVIHDNARDHRCNSGSSLLGTLPFDVGDIRWSESWDFT